MVETMTTTVAAMEIITIKVMKDQEDMEVDMEMEMDTEMDMEMVMEIVVIMPLAHIKK